MCFSLKTCTQLAVQNYKKKVIRNLHGTIKGQGRHCWVGLEGLPTVLLGEQGMIPYTRKGRPLRNRPFLVSGADTYLIT